MAAVARVVVRVSNFAARDCVLHARLRWAFVIVNGAKQANIARGAPERAGADSVELALAAFEVGRGHARLAKMGRSALLQAVLRVVDYAAFDRAADQKILAIFAGDARIRDLIEFLTVFSSSIDAGLGRHVEVILSLIAAVAIVCAGLELGAAHTLISSIIKPIAAKASGPGKTFIVRVKIVCRESAADAGI